MRLTFLLDMFLNNLPAKKQVILGSDKHKSSLIIQGFQLQLISQLVKATDRSSWFWIYVVLHIPTSRKLHKSSRNGIMTAMERLTHQTISSLWVTAAGMPMAVTLLTGAKIKSRCTGVADITVLQTMGESEVAGFTGVYGWNYASILFIDID